MSLSLCPRLRYSLFKQCQKNKYLCEGTTRIFSNLEYAFQYPVSATVASPLNSNYVKAENILCATSSVCHGRSKKSIYRKRSGSFKYKTANIKHDDLERRKLQKLKNRRLELLKSEKLVYNKTDKLQQKDEELKSRTVYPTDYKMTRELKWLNMATTALGIEQPNSQYRLKTMPNVHMIKEDFSVHGTHDMGIQKCTNINKDAIYDEAIELPEPVQQQPGDSATNQPGAAEGEAKVDAKDEKKAKSETEEYELPKIFGKLRSTLKKWFHGEGK